MIDMDISTELLPPRPGEVVRPPEGSGNKDVPVIIYINGKPVTMTKFEALGAVAQIAQVLLYLEAPVQNPEQTKGKK